MSNQLSITEQIFSLEKKFNGQNAFALKFENECLFAKQLITKNDFTMSTAQNNPASLKAAILNVAAIGISLNPAMAHSYLVPRDGGICLDISYKGMVKLATDSGSISYAKAVLVYKGDDFKANGPFDLPDHQYDPFNADRINASNPLDNLAGGYCAAKLPDGSYIIDFMTAGEILEVRDSSKAKNGPWKGKWSGEMAKKTLIKRASKSWPQSNGRERLDTAIQVLNEHEGDEEIITASASDYLTPSKEQTETYLEMAKGDSVDFWLWYRDLDQRIQAALPNCEFEPRQKGKMMAMFNSALKDGRERLEEWCINFQAVCESDDEIGGAEILEELPANQVQALIDAMPTELSMFAQSITTGE